MTTRRILEFLVAHHRGLRWLLVVVMAALVIVDIAVPPAYTRFPWDGIGGFAAFYGLFASVVLIGIAKALGHGLVYRSEDYYDDGGNGDD